MDAIFIDDEAAEAFLEARRWRNDARCPYCATPDRFGRLRGTATRRSMFKCYACRKFFTLRTGTVLEGSHLSNVTLLSGIMMIAASNGQIGPSTLASSLGVTLQTAMNLRNKLTVTLRRAFEGRRPPTMRASLKHRIDNAMTADMDLPAVNLSCSRQVRQQRRLALLDALITPEAYEVFVTLIDHVFTEARAKSERAVPPAADTGGGRPAGDADLPERVNAAGSG
jgi:transposase-like protein